MRLRGVRLEYYNMLVIPNNVSTKKNPYLKVNEMKRFHAQSAATQLQLLVADMLSLAAAIKNTYSHIYKIIHTVF